MAEISISTENKYFGGEHKVITLKQQFLGIILCFLCIQNIRGYCVSLRKCVRLYLHTVGSDTIFFNLYGRTPRGPRGVKKSEFFFTNESVEFLPFWLTKHK